jgi:hypothetical protein
MKNWKTATMGLFLLGVGLVHTIWPQRLAMDWPSVALIFGGVLFFVAEQVRKWLPYLKRLKIGEAEIELQEKLGDLRENIKVVFPPAVVQRLSRRTARN